MWLLLLWSPFLQIPSVWFGPPLFALLCLQEINYLQFADYHLSNVPNEAPVMLWWTLAIKVLSGSNIPISPPKKVPSLRQVRVVKLVHLGQLSCTSCLFLLKESIGNWMGDGVSL